jgi:GMP synthase (glutamine-hydrolysing)
MEKIAILDFGSQYTQLIARKIRELNVFSEIHPFNVALDILKNDKVKGVILSGGPSSIYEENAPKISDKILFPEIVKTFSLFIYNFNIS